MSLLGSDCWDETADQGVASTVNTLELLYLRTTDDDGHRVFLAVVQRECVEN